MMTHNVMEPFAVSLFRCLPRSHPVYKLLRPHLQSVPGINSQARVTLIKSGTDVNKSLAMGKKEYYDKFCIENFYPTSGDLEGEDLVKIMFRTFEMDELDIKKVLERKGKIYHRQSSYEIKLLKSFV